MPKRIIIQLCLSFLETPLYLIPKAHPDSKKPWLEWRLSFSLVEKKIFDSVPYIFHKVYLHCKSLTRIWKGKYNFPSYVLKTVFLWNYEDWQKSENEFTEDGILEMVLQLFINLYEYYKEGVLPMYFIPEVNLLAQYSKTEQENIITELKALADLQSLSSSICKNSSKPFCQISVPYISLSIPALLVAVILCNHLTVIFGIYMVKKFIKIKELLTMRINWSSSMNCMLLFYYC